MPAKILPKMINLEKLKALIKKASPLASSIALIADKNFEQLSSENSTKTTKSLRAVFTTSRNFDAKREYSHFSVS